VFCSTTHKLRGYLADLIDASWYEDVLPNDGAQFYLSSSFVSQTNFPAEIVLPPEFSVDPDAEDLSNLLTIWLDFLTFTFSRHSRVAKARRRDVERIGPLPVYNRPYQLSLNCKYLWFVVIDLFLMILFILAQNCFDPFTPTSRKILSS